MIGNVALDVFIGLVFVYLLYSLLATLLQEIIASFLNLRAAVLVKAIRIMLNDRKPLNITSRFLIVQLWQRFLFTLQMQWHHLACRLPDATLAKAFYKHPSIKYLSPNSLRSKPSYIEPQNFSATLIQMLRGKNYDGSVPQMLAIYSTLFPMKTAASDSNMAPKVEVGKTDPVLAYIQPETLDRLQQLYIDSQKDLTAFALSLESWYNQTMDRATGWYKRQTRRILFFLGLFIAILGNVDTIKIYHILSKDKTAREQMVQLAIQARDKYADVVDKMRQNEQPPPQPGDTAAPKGNADNSSNDSLTKQLYKQALQAVQSDIEQSNYVLAMGWHESAKYKLYGSLDDRRDSLKQALKEKENKNNQQLKAQLHSVKQQMRALSPEVYDKYDGVYSLLGWLITALALTLGAPFWFDLLTKFMSIRSAGAKPAQANNAADVPSPVLPAALQFKAGGVAGNSFAATESDQPEVVPDEAADNSIAQG